LTCAMPLFTREPQAPLPESASCGPVRPLGCVYERPHEPNREHRSAATDMSRYFDDFTLDDVYRSAVGRTITDTDNIWFTLLTNNTNQVHFNQFYAEKTPWKKLLVNSGLTLSIVGGLSVPDVSENAIANLGWTDIRLPKPVFAGDTLWAETEVTELRESRSRPYAGIVGVRTRGINQHGEVVIEFRRTIMVYKRGYGNEERGAPMTTEEWRV
jgi:itaconyl-CoA hydratase